MRSGHARHGTCGDFGEAGCVSHQNPTSGPSSFKRLQVGVACVERLVELEVEPRCTRRLAFDGCYRIVRDVPHEYLRLWIRNRTPHSHFPQVALVDDLGKLHGAGWTASRSSNRKDESWTQGPTLLRHSGSNLLSLPGFGRGAPVTFLFN